MLSRDYFVGTYYVWKFKESQWMNTIVQVQKYVEKVYIVREKRMQQKAINLLKVISKMFHIVKGSLAQ